MAPPISKRLASQNCSSPICTPIISWASSLSSETSSIRPSQTSSTLKNLIEIYGPAGIRTFVRSVLTMTLSRMADNYVVHELLTSDDDATPCHPPELMHINEVQGRDIRCSPDSGFWREITKAKGLFGDIVVDAGPISHRDPCIGYIIRESSHPSRKIVVLGDTDDPSAITPLCTSPSPSLLIHEATDAHIPRHIDSRAKRSPETVREKALSRGHSIPEMAGAFAKVIGAQKLVLNHIGGRFPAPRHARDNPRTAVMREIERQATEAWGMGKPAVAAWDFMRVAIPAPDSAVVTRRGRDREDELDLAHANPEEGFLYTDRKKPRR